MSGDLPGPDQEKVKPKAKQDGADAKGGEQLPSIAPSGERTEQESKTNSHKACKHNWTKWVEIVFKAVEVAAFIAIIFTFLEMRQTRIQDERAWVIPFD